MPSISRLASLLVAFAISSQVFAQDSVAQVGLGSSSKNPFQDIAADMCGPGVKECRGADVLTVTEYHGTPVYVTHYETVIQNKTHTTTSTSVVAAMVTSIKEEIGICETVTTTSVTTPKTIPVTELKTKVIHIVEGTVVTSTTTYTVEIPATSACIISKSAATSSAYTE